MNHRRLLIIMAVVALSEQTLITKLVGLKALKKYAVLAPHASKPSTEILIEYTKPQAPYPPVVQDRPYPAPADPPTHYGSTTLPPPTTTLPPPVVTTTEAPVTSPPYVPHETYGIPTLPPVVVPHEEYGVPTNAPVVVPHEDYGVPTLPPVHVQPTEYPEPEPVEVTTQQHPLEDCPPTKLQANLYQLDTSFGGNAAGQVHLYPAVPLTHTGNDVVTTWYTGVVPVDPSQIQVEDPKPHFLGTPFEKVVETTQQQQLPAYVNGLTVPSVVSEAVGQSGGGMVWAAPSQPLTRYGPPGYFNQYY